MMQVPLSLGLFALVDDADYEHVMAAGQWSARPSGQTVYAQRRLSRPGRSATTQSLHTFLTGWPYVDHRNGDGLDNQRHNIRQSTHAQNTANRRLPKSSTTGFKGVTRRKRDGRYQAQIGAHGRHYHLGYHFTAEAAARAYDAAALRLFGEFARINFPEVIQ
jgi:hypothetical protein